MPLGKLAAKRGSDVDTIEDLVDGSLVPSDNGGAPFIRVTGLQGKIQPTALQLASKHKLPVALDNAWDGGTKKAAGRNTAKTGLTPIVLNSGNGGGKAAGRKK